MAYPNLNFALIHHFCRQDKIPFDLKNAYFQAILDTLELKIGKYKDGLGFKNQYFWGFFGGLKNSLKDIVILEVKHRKKLRKVKKCDLLGTLQIALMVQEPFLNLFGKIVNTNIELILQFFDDDIFVDIQEEGILFKDKTHWLFVLDQYEIGYQFKFFGYCDEMFFKQVKELLKILSTLQRPVFIVENHILKFFDLETFAQGQFDLKFELDGTYKIVDGLMFQMSEKIAELPDFNNRFLVSLPFKRLKKDISIDLENAQFKEFQGNWLALKEIPKLEYLKPKNFYKTVDGLIIIKL